jgi:ADP-ribose pyrophosphatase YjhB (NUDIX family)
MTLPEEEVAEVMNKLTGFTIRVYGLLINDLGEVLLSKEKIGDFHFTKFPGGGLELGEGIKDCLIREFKEEVNIDIEVLAHHYTTDFYQQSAFRATDQIISIYYKVKSLSDMNSIRLDEFDIENNGRIEQQQLVWVPVSELTPEMVTFPIDQYVVGLLRQELAI